MNPVICIPTKRPPPIRTLLSFPIPIEWKTLVIADPSVYAAHYVAYKANPMIEVIRGLYGMGPQAGLCYSESAKRNYSHFFRLDDDLRPKTYASKKGYLSLDEALHSLVECITTLKPEVSLVGFSNTSNAYWLGEGFKHTYGLVTGGTNLAISYHNPEKFTDPRVHFSEDFYRSCAHREYSGDIGRVNYIGFDCREAMKDSTITGTQEQRDLERDVILKRFPNMVTCTGVSKDASGRYLYRMKR